MDRVLVSAVNSVQRQFLPNGLPLMDDLITAVPSEPKEKILGAQLFTQVGLLSRMDRLGSGLTARSFFLV